MRVHIGSWSLGISIFLNFFFPGQSPTCYLTISVEWLLCGISFITMWGYQNNIIDWKLLTNTHLKVYSKKITVHTGVKLLESIYYNIGLMEKVIWDGLLVLQMTWGACKTCNFSHFWWFLGVFHPCRAIKHKISRQYTKKIKIPKCCTVFSQIPKNCEIWSKSLNSVGI